MEPEHSRFTALGRRRSRLDDLETMPISEATKPPPAPRPDIRTLLVHYWIVNRRGGEAVLEAIGRLFPQADLLANVVKPDRLYGSLTAMKLRTTFVNGLPAAQKIYPLYMPLMPIALEAIDTNPYELIISSEAGPAKWVLPRPDAKHICYCHSPMRYVWDQRASYLRKLPAILRPLGQLAGQRLRQADLISTFRVTDFVANSTFVQSRIKQYYRRDAEVIHPPIDVEAFTAAEPEDFYLCAGQVVSYKRLELAVEACNRLGRRLVIAGGGDISRLRQIAGPKISFLGPVETPVLHDLMRRCRALLFPGLEDFGIIPVEVMASGRPVIAYGRGGAVDSVEPGISGVLFDRQDVEGMIAGIHAFEAEEKAFTAEGCRGSAKRFSRANFEARFSALVDRVMV